MIDSFILFNISYNFIYFPGCSLELQYHKVVMALLHKTRSNSNFTCANGKSSIKIIENYITQEINNLQDCLNALEILKKQLESSLYINVPQVNKNYSKKYKAFDFIDSFKSKIVYKIVKNLLAKKLNVFIENFVSILQIVKIVREQDNINVISMDNQQLIVKILKELKLLSVQMEIDLNTAAFEENFNKLII